MRTEELNGFYQVIIETKKGTIGIAGYCRGVVLLGAPAIQVTVSHQDHDPSIVTVPAAKVLLVEACTEVDAQVIGDRCLNFVHEQVKNFKARDEKRAEQESELDKLLAQLMGVSRSSSVSADAESTNMCEGCSGFDECKEKGLVTA